MTRQTWKPARLYGKTTSDGKHDESGRVERFSQSSPSASSPLAAWQGRAQATMRLPTSRPPPRLARSILNPSGPQSMVFFFLLFPSCWVPEEAHEPSREVSRE